MCVKKTLIVCSLMIITAWCVKYYAISHSIKPIRSLALFPKTIGEWNGKQEYLSDTIQDVLGVDDYFYGHYSNLDRQEIELYLGFYEKQSFGDQIHSPKHCMPGAGWNIIKTSVETLTLDSKPPVTIEATKLILEKYDKRLLMIYWFQSHGRFIASEYLQRAYLVIDSFTRRRTDGALVRLIAPLPDNPEAEEKTLHYVKRYISLILPLIAEYIPS